MATKHKADLKSNPAIPGTLNREEPNYLRNVQQSAQQELQRRNINQRALQRISQLIDQAQRYQAGHEDTLQRLAERIIRDNYGPLLDFVQLNLKLVAFGDVTEETPRYDTVLPEPPDENQQQQMAEEAQQRQDQRVQQQPQDQNQQPSQKLLEDEDIALEVHKRKIINNVVQGEGKNTHRLIHLPEVREELDRINANLFPTYDEILKIAEFLDWVMPSDEKLHMMQNMPQFFGGFNSVDWMPSQPNFKNDDDGEQNMGDVEEIRDGKDPVITAVGVDFPMLIHETVKGIYELIASNAIPSDAYVAETVMLNTDTLQDEIEDLRYGPFIAADLRDFVNANPLSNQVKNLREHVFGKMTLMPTDEFLALMKGILMKTPRSRAFIDELCQEVEAEVRQNALDIAFAEGDVDAAIPQEDDDVLDPETEKAPKPVQAVKEIDYSKKTKKELNELINDALEAGDYATVDKLRHFL